MANYPQTTEAAVTRAALDASTEAGRVVILLIAENARLREQVAALREDIAALWARDTVREQKLVSLERLRDDKEERKQ